MARPVSHPTLYAERQKGGTLTIYLQRPDRQRERWTTGIPTEDEAFRRMAVLKEMCGYKVDKRIKEKA